MPNNALKLLKVAAVCTRAAKQSADGDTDAMRTSIDTAIKQLQDIRGMATDAYMPPWMTVEERDAVLSELPGGFWRVPTEGETIEPSWLVWVGSKWRRAATGEDVGSPLAQALYVAPQG